MNLYPPKFNIAPEKLPKPNRKGLSSFATIFEGFPLAVKLRGSIPENIKMNYC